MFEDEALAERSTVLLVEDDEVDAEWAVRALNRETDGLSPLHVEHVVSLSAALDRLELNDVHAVVLDLQLPDENHPDEGIERIRDINPGLPIVVYTSAPYDMAGLLTIEKGALYYFAKSSGSPEQLARIVHLAIERHAMQMNIQTVIEYSLDGMAVIDEEAQLLFANPAARKMLDIGPDQSSFTYPAEIRTGQPIEFEYNDLVIESRMMDIVWNARSAYLATLRDVTRDIQLKEQIQRAQRMEAVGILASGLAHDYSNLLTLISGYSDMLEGQLPAGSELTDYVTQIKQATDSASKLTRRVLSLGRTDTRELERVDMNTLIRGNAGLLRKSLGADMQLTIRTCDDEATVFMDMTEFQQVMINLALNARDAMPNGGQLIIEVDVVELSEPLAGILPVPPGRFVTVTVADKGEGMDDNALTHAFEPFFTTKTRDAGTGLGLPMVYTHMQQFNGGITLETAPGEGTRFTLYFPLITPEAGPSLDKR